MPQAYQSRHPRDSDGKVATGAQAAARARSEVRLRRVPLVLPTEEMAVGEQQALRREMELLSNRLASLERAGKRNRLGAERAATAAELDKLRRELKQTARFLLTEIKAPAQGARTAIRELRTRLTAIEALGRRGDAANSSPARSLVDSHDLIQLLRPLVSSLHSETLDRQGDLIADAVGQVAQEIRELEEDVESRITVFAEEVSSLGKQLEAVHAVALDGATAARARRAKNSSPKPAEHLKEEPTHRTLEDLVLEVDAVSSNMPTVQQRGEEAFAKAEEAFNIAEQGKLLIQECQEALGKAQTRLDKRIDELLYSSSFNEQKEQETGSTSHDQSEAALQNAPSLAPAPLPPHRRDVWERHISADGLVYYHNRSTGESSWLHPSTSIASENQLSSSKSALARVAANGSSDVQVQVSVRVAALEQALAEERSGRLLFEEASHRQLRTLSR